MSDLSQIPGWVVLIDSLALESLRTHLRIEFDLRAVLRSQDEPESVLRRAEAILEQGAEITIRHLLTARGLLLVNRFSICEEQSRRLAEQVGGMHLLLLSRISGLACVGIFKRKADEKSVEFAQLAAGMLPLVVELERDTASLFEKSRDETGISAA